MWPKYCETPCINTLSFYYIWLEEYCYHVIPILSNVYRLYEKTLTRTCMFLCNIVRLLFFSLQLQNINTNTILHFQWFIWLLLSFLTTIWSHVVVPNGFIHWVLMRVKDSIQRLDLSILFLKSMWWQCRHYQSVQCLHTINPVSFI